MSDELRRKMEPGTQATWQGAAISLAISMKRIADALSAPDLMVLGGQIENIAWSAGRAFESGRKQ